MLETHSFCKNLSNSHIEINVSISWQHLYRFGEFIKIQTFLYRDDSKCKKKQFLIEQNHR